MGKFQESSYEPGRTRVQLTAEQLRLLYQRIPGELVVHLVAATVLALTVLGSVPVRTMAAWAACLFLVSAYRAGTTIACHREHPGSDQLGVWHRRHAAGALFSGITWGATGLLPFIQGGLFEPFNLVFVLGAVTVGAYVSMVTAITSFSLFMISAWLPLTAWFASQGNDRLIAIAGLILVSMGILIHSSRKLGLNLNKASSVAANNAELIRKLVKAKEQSEKATQATEQANKELQEQIKQREKTEDRVRASGQQLRSILDNMQDTLFRTDQNGNLVWVSPSVFRLLGYRPEEILNTPMKRFRTSQEHGEQFMPELSLYDGQIDNLEMELIRKDGRRIWVAASCHYYYGSFGNIAGTEGTLKDITARKITEEALFQEKERAQVTLESIGDGVITTDVKGHVEYLNPIAESFTGWRNADAQGVPVTRVLRLIDENSEKTLPSPTAQCLRNQQVVNVTGHPLLIHRDGGQRFSVQLSTAPIRDSANEIIGTVLVFHDVTELRGLARQMSHQATHDSLTGLINRREFDRRCQHALEHAYAGGAEHALCYLDLDQFKVVNDTCGHKAGDELLKQLTTRLQSRLREADTLARLGGDEFGVLLTGCTLVKALEIAETLRATVDEFRFVWNNQSFRVGVSIGLVPIGARSGQLSELMSAADSACYIAKEQGRNRIHVFQTDDRAIEERKGQMRWTQRIQHALENDRFCLHFQPIIRLGDQPDRASGMQGEVLLRMYGDDDQLILPGAFLPSAERYQLMPSVDQWVVEHTFRMLAERDSILPGLLTCSINLSGQSISDARFLDRIVYLMLHAGVPPELLCFEITESAVVADLGNSARFVTELREMGCRFALDDFGSGLSSFSYLKQVPVDFIKLDGSFVRNMANDQTDEAMVRAIHQIGHVMGIQTIAECVENAETLKALRRIGIDYAQGFGIAKSRSIIVPRQDTGEPRRETELLRGGRS